MASFAFVIYKISVALRLRDGETWNEVKLHKDLQDRAIRKTLKKYWWRPITPSEAYIDARKIEVCCGVGIHIKI